jgi:ubiquinol-cytochrome c reductase cytochrome b subunit
VLAMFGSLGLLALVPWLDRSPVKSARFRPLYPYFFWLLLGDCFLLGYCGAHPPEGWYLPASRVGTAYFYLHFLVVLPLLALFERPRPLPRSIGESVLRSRGGSPVPHGQQREMR